MKIVVQNQPHFFRERERLVLSHGQSLGLTAFGDNNPIEHFSRKYSLELTRSGYSASPPRELMRPPYIGRTTTCVGSSETAGSSEALSCARLVGQYSMRRYVN